MRTCRGCGGVLGRDCFNEPECIWITESINSDNARDAEAYRRPHEQDEPRHEDYETMHFLLLENEYLKAECEKLKSIIDEFNRK